ncbi:MAG: hypothetical protein BGN92_15355 [Sphingobacteriales bacterium 41-5]|nr:MAG: hypothetical protein BGN92_15355 [Sphingobacteriales bacterium 41-5]
MANQTYKNHVRYYPPHHFIFYPILTILTVIAFYRHFTDKPNQLIWFFIAIGLVLIGWLSVMMRQHYALTLQNRLVRLEMRHKYFVLTGKDFEPLEKNLSFGQIGALRFASDEELIALIEKTLAENLPPDAIKKRIANWKPDEMRV